MPLSRFKNFVARLWKGWRAHRSAPKRAFIPQRKTPPPLPTWSKKDWFEPKELGTMVPPEEMADAGTLRRPGKWLQDKMGHHDEKLVEMTNKRTKGRQQLPDADLEKFLQDLLQPSDSANPSDPNKSKK